MTKVSLIVPVYNAEKNISRCVDSILNQEFSDLEVILIDDGSSDGSPAILDEYAAKDERVKVIHQKNAGVSAARNAGLEMAQGTYIQFLDSDDWIPADSTKLLVRAMEECDCDLVVAGFYRVSGEYVAAKASVYDDRVLTLQEYAEYMKENPADYYFGVLWNKLYKNELIRDNGLHMDESLSFCEDFVFNLEYLLHSEKIRALTVPVYYYVRTEGSLVTKNLNPSRIISMKLNVFTYYDRFFRQILDQEDYNSERIGIARFLVAAAGDDMVIPMMPGTSRLGEETVKISFRSENESPVITSYYQKKLFERYLNTIAVKYDLVLRDVWVLAAISLSDSIYSTKEIADFTSYTEVGVIASLQKLMFDNYVEMDYSDHQMCVRIHSGADEIRRDLENAAGDLYAVLTKGFSEEEMKNLSDYYRRIAVNVRTLMKAQDDSESR